MAPGTLDLGEDAAIKASQHSEDNHSPPPDYDHGNHILSAEAVDQRLADLQLESARSSSDSFTHHSLSTVPTATSTDTSSQNNENYNPATFGHHEEGNSSHAVQDYVIQDPDHQHRALSFHSESTFDHVPPPAYSETGNYKELEVEENGLSSKARILSELAMLHILF